MNKRSNAGPIISLRSSFNLLGIAALLIGYVVLSGSGRMARELGLDERPLKRILFIGNSYTESGKLPLLVEEMVNESPAPFRLAADSVVHSGADWQELLEGTDALTYIRENGYDWIVLQNHSESALDGRRGRMPEEFARFSQAQDTSKAEFLLFCTWARKDSPADQATITATYCRLAGSTGARLVPVGPAWDYVRRTASWIELFSEDGSHPSVHGIYLNAATFYGAITGKSPVGLKQRHVLWNSWPVEIEESAARILQTAAQWSLDSSPAICGSAG